MVKEITRLVMRGAPAQGPGSVLFRILGDDALGIIERQRVTVVLRVELVHLGVHLPGQDAVAHLSTHLRLRLRQVAVDSQAGIFQPAMFARGPKMGFADDSGPVTRVTRY